MQSLKRIPNGAAYCEIHPVYSGTWRNTPDLYTQAARIDEIDVKLRLLLEKYGESFDDNWWYWLTAKGRGKGLFVKRVPIWQTSKKMPAEKPRPFPVLRHQKRLEEVTA